MKKYKVNGKIVIADSLREAIVKYRKFNDAFVLKHFFGKYLSENGDFVFDIDNARRFSTENEAKAKANAMSSEDDTFTVVSVKDAQNYSAGQKFRDPKGRIWEVKSVNGDLLTIAVDGKEMSNKLHKEIFAEWAKTWDVADSVKDYDDEYYEIRYEFTFNGVKRTAKVLVKAKAETDAKSKFANDKTKDGTEKIISVKKLSEDEVNKLIGYGVYVIDDSVKDYDTLKIGDIVYETDGVRVYENRIENISKINGKIIYDCGRIEFDESAIGNSIFIRKEDAIRKMNQYK